MPSSSADQTLAVRVVDSMERMSGRHPGYRRSSARGAGFRATFTPTGEAAALTTAAHLQTRTVPATVRFSNSEGDPRTPDTAPVTRGMATRFHLHDDATHDPSTVWPDHRKEIAAGRLEITAPADDQDPWNTQAFNPTRVTTGIQLSDDPVLAFRAHAYAESHFRRSHNQ